MLLWGREWCLCCHGCPLCSTTSDRLPSAKIGYPTPSLGHRRAMLPPSGTRSLPELPKSFGRRTPGRTTRPSVHPFPFVLTQFADHLIGRQKSSRKRLASNCQAPVPANPSSSSSSRHEEASVSRGRPLAPKAILRQYKDSPDHAFDLFSPVSIPRERAHRYL